MSKEKLYLYPIWLRIWHGLNAVSIIALIVTGLNLQYTSIDSTILTFSKAVTFHNIFGIMLAILFIPFLFGNFFTKNGKYYRIPIKGLMERMIIQSKFYLIGYFKNEDPPYPISEKRKFNPLQRVSYILAMYIFLPMVIISGFGLLFPEFIIHKVFGFSGIQLTAIFHSIVGFFISFFLVIHIYIASIGKKPSKNFKSIITGYH